MTWHRWVIHARVPDYLRLGWLALPSLEGTGHGITPTVAQSSQVRNAAIEECARIAETQAQEFLSPEYAANQPLGSFCERFACDEVAKAIRALAAQPPAAPVETMADQILRADAEPPEASFDNAEDMLAYLNAPARSSADNADVRAACDWPSGEFSFYDEPGEHDPCYVVMPGGAMLPLNHHTGEGVDIARAKFIIAACNAALLPAVIPMLDDLIPIFRDAASVNMTEDAVDRQAKRFAEAVLTMFDVRQLGGSQVPSSVDRCPECGINRNSPFPCEHRIAEPQTSSAATEGFTELDGLIEDLGWVRQRVRNCRGAIESDQVTDKDVRGSLLKVGERLDAILQRLAIQRIHDQPQGARK